MEDKKTPEEILDEAVESLKGQKLEADQLDEIAGRVRRELDIGVPVPAGIHGCRDFQSLIPEYLAGNLSAARRMLLEDHVQSCLSCRKALTAARTHQVSRPRAVPEYSVNRWLRWGSLAAGLVLAVLLVQVAAWNGLVPGYSPSVATLESSQGVVLVVSDRDVVPLENGAKVDATQLVRTGKDADAILRLSDGSKVELGNRTELAVREGWRDTTIRLGRGKVIVEAAKQGSGHLYVSTNDCRVAVKGTVFSVAHGMSGSRVAVIKGEVWVEKGGKNTVLMPGEQYASRPQLSRVSLESEFSWSRNSSDHLVMMREIAELQKKVSQATLSKQLRYTSDLVGYLPEGTVVYGAFPNVSGQLVAVYNEFQQRLQTDSTIAQWMSQHEGSEQGLADLDQFVQKAQQLGSLIGEEVVIALTTSGDATEPMPMLLAHVLDEAQFSSLVRTEVEEINAKSDRGPIFFVVTDPQNLPGAEQKGMILYVGSGLMIASPSVDVIRQIADEAMTSTGGGFVGTRFFQTVADSYSQGVDWLFAVDMQRLFASGMVGTKGGEIQQDRGLQKLGLAGVQDLVMERKQNLGTPESRAVLTYDGPAEGMISWLAQPGPMGGLDFVSPSANLVAAFVVSDPVKMVDDVFGWIGESDSTALSDLLNFQSEHGLDIRQDIAAPLGGEVVLAVDGPIVPTPSWKVILEVYQPDVLQHTISRIVEEVNQLAAEHGEPGFTLEVGNSGGTALYQIHSEKLGMTIYYQFLNGYLVAAPDPALIQQALQCRTSGANLANSPAFISLLPQEVHVNVSGLYYHNLSPLLEPLLSSGLAQSLPGSDQDRANLRAMLENSPPVVAALYSQPGRIIVTGSGDFQSLWGNLAAVSSLGGPGGIARILSGQSQ
jgi:hypothetical protein